MSMSILIRGMEMPKNCWECPCFHIKRDPGYYDYEKCDASGTIFNDGYSSVTGHKDHIDPFKERLGNCPLVPVPPHGRLIDADALLKPKNQHVDVHSNEWYVELRTIEDAPTIIEAEEGEE